MAERPMEASSYDEATADDYGAFVEYADALEVEVEHLREAVDEAITTLALLRGHVDPGETFDSEPWQAINAAVRRGMQATGEMPAADASPRQEDAKEIE